jgi:hypothetical protein
MTPIADPAENDVEQLDAFHDLLPALARALDVRDTFQHISAVASHQMLKLHPLRMNVGALRGSVRAIKG